MQENINPNWSHAGMLPTYSVIKECKKGLFFFTGRVEAVNQQSPTPSLLFGISYHFCLMQHWNFSVSLTLLFSIGFLIFDPLNSRFFHQMQYTPDLHLSKCCFHLGPLCGLIHRVVVWHRPQCLAFLSSLLLLPHLQMLVKIKTEQLEVYHLEVVFFLKKNNEILYKYWL